MMHEVADREGVPMIDVIYVAGPARSGSTLLGEILGSQPGVFNAGELSLFWRDAARGNSCACGEPLTSCILWGAALERVRVRIGLRTDQYQVLADARAELARTTRPRRLTEMVRRDPSNWSAAQRLLVTATAALHEAALRIHGATTLVDTSKTLPALRFHGLLPHRRLTVVHLIRDPRAVVASTMRSRDVLRGNPGSLPPGGNLGMAITRWWWANCTAMVGARTTHRALRLRYEDLIASPAARTREVCETAGIGFDATTLADSVLRPPTRSHAAVGNPRRGAELTPLTLDDRWRHELSPQLQYLIRAVTWPLDAAL